MTISQFGVPYRPPTIPRLPQAAMFSAAPPRAGRKWPRPLWRGWSFSRAPARAERGAFGQGGIPRGSGASFAPPALTVPVPPPCWGAAIGLGVKREVKHGWVVISLFIVGQTNWEITRVLLSPIEKLHWNLEKLTGQYLPLLSTQKPFFFLG